MSAYKLYVTEQPPLEKSIFCECRLANNYGGTLDYGHMYFTCGHDRKIIQYPAWLKGYRKTLKKLGYTL